MVEEEVPIKDFRLILQTLSTCSPEDKDPVSLTEQVRIGLKRTLTHKYSEEGNRVSALTLDQEIEDEVRGAIRQNGQECFLVLAPERLKYIAQTVKACLSRSRGTAVKPVLLTQLEIRRYVRKIVEHELPQLPVLSYQELDPKAVIHPLGVVSPGWDGATVVFAS